MKPSAVWILAIAVSAATVPARAQNARLVSPDWPHMAALEHLQRAGVVTLDPLTRPWSQADVVRALERVDTSAVAPTIAQLVARLRANLAADTMGLAVDAFVGALAASDAGRWALRPAPDSSSGLFPLAGISASLRFPHVAVVTSPRIDNRLRSDPDYRGKKDRFIAGRNPEVYVAAAWPLAEVFVGQVDRNWGPEGIESLVLSSSPYTYDHFFVRLGPARLRLELLATQLDNRYNVDGTDNRQRFLSAHRLIVQPTSRLTLSLFESTLYADASTERSFEPWYLNPANLFLLAQYDGVETSNALVGADVVHRGERLTLAGQVYLDNVQVDDSVARDRQPPGYGVTFVAGGGALSGRATGQALYTRVTNLAYRTQAAEEAYLYREVGIGRNWADYDQATVRLSVLAHPRLLWGAELSWLRQGEGDPRAPFPPDSLLAATPTTFAGTVERTARLAGRAEWWPRRGVLLRGELGLNLLDNAGHSAGASRTRWVWRLNALVRRRCKGALPL